MKFERIVSSFLCLTGLVGSSQLTEAYYYRFFCRLYYQDPELMAEAKKMMDNPNFQKQMKEMGNTKEFKDATKASVDMMNDPGQAAAMEAKMEHMMKVGNDQLKNKAGNVMEDAFAAMGNPEVMAEMQKMIKDPNFQQQLNEMAKDPNMQGYMDAMKDMMKDPEKKRQMEMIGNKMKNEL